MNYTQSKTSHSHHTSTTSSNTTARDSYLNNLATHTHLFPTHKSRASLSPPTTGFTELRRICLSISFTVTLYVYRNEIRSFLTFVAVPAAAHSEPVYNKFLTYVFLELWTNILDVVKCKLLQCEELHERLDCKSMEIKWYKYMRKWYTIR